MIDNREDLRKISPDTIVSAAALEAAKGPHRDHLTVNLQADGDFAKKAFAAAARDTRPNIRPFIIGVNPLFPTKFTQPRLLRARSGRVRRTDYSQPAQQAGVPSATMLSPRQTKRAAPKSLSPALTFPQKNMRVLLERLAKDRDLLNLGETLTIERLPNGAYRLVVTGVNLEQAAIAQARIAENTADLADGVPSLTRVHAKAKGKGLRAVQDLEPNF